MMFEDRLNNRVLERGYARLTSNIPGVYLYYRKVEEELCILSVITMPQGKEYTLEQYQHILNQIRNNFTGNHGLKCNILSLILTQEVGKVRSYCTENQEITHWIVDFSTHRLIIYENQARDVDNLRPLLEGILEEEANLGSVSFAQPDVDSQRVRQNPGKQGNLAPTLVNSLIILANILMHVILHFTAFGESIFDKGVLGWYLVWEKREYYRLLTAMFMHGDLSHLFNNMLLLFFVGSTLERTIGKGKFLSIYFGSGIIAGIASIGYNMWKEKGIVTIFETTHSIGASGAIFGVVGAILFILLINKGRLEEIDLRQMVFFSILSLYNGFMNATIDQAGHVGGFIGGFLLAALIYRVKNKKSHINQNTY